MPNIYLPSYARALGLSSIAGTVTITLFNSMSIFGQVIRTYISEPLFPDSDHCPGPRHVAGAITSAILPKHVSAYYVLSAKSNANSEICAEGALTDRLHVTTVILMSTIGATLSVFLLWGLSASLPILCIFSVMYGLSAGGFSSTWTGATQEIRKRDDNAELGMVFGLLAAGRGIGSVVSGPLSEALLSGEPWRGEAKLGYGTGYGPLIVFTGISAIFGGFSWVGRRAGWV